MKVFVNGVEVGTVMNGETLQVSIGEGPSVVYARMDWWLTPKVQIFADTGTAYQFVIGLDIWKAFTHPVAWLPFIEFEGYTLQLVAPIAPPISPYPR